MYQRYKISLKNKYPEISLDVLKWKSRRGLLENDLILEKFFNIYGNSLSSEDMDGLKLLLGLNDNDLLDLFLRKTNLSGSVDLPHVRNVLNKLRDV